MVTAQIFQILTGRVLAIFHECLNNAFVFTEFLAYYFFFTKCLQKPKFKKLTKLFLWVILIIISIFIIKLNSHSYDVIIFEKHSILINVIEFFFILILCLIYFYELLTTPPKIDLYKRPSFFIVTSTFFYSALMIPFFVIAIDVLNMEKKIYDMLFACHYVLLIIMLITILKSFLCKKAITT